MDANVGAMLDCARIGDALHEIHNSRHDPLLVGHKIHNSRHDPLLILLS